MESSLKLTTKISSGFLNMNGVIWVDTLYANQKITPEGDT